MGIPFKPSRKLTAENAIALKKGGRAQEIRKFVDHINDCLQRNGRSLSAAGIQKLGEYTGEVIANAEEHSDRGEWQLSGYLDNATTEHMCEISVTSFGDSIADSFLRLPPSNYAMIQVRPYLDAHRERGIFGTTWKDDDLLTLVALQGGISCKNASRADTRGKGTIDLIAFFEQVHSECAGDSKTPCEMAIISGRTYIRFDGTYKMRRDSTGRDVIAFNRSNRLEDPPDTNYVRRLPKKIPGTVIAMRFALSRSFTQPANHTSNG